MVFCISRRIAAVLRVPPALRSRSSRAVVTGDAAHVVVNGRQHRDRLACHIDPGEDARGLGDAWQALVNDPGAKVLEMQIDVIMLAAHSAALADLHRHGPAHDIA